MEFFAQPPLIEALPGQALQSRAVDLKLKDKVALITGSSRGIGLATAKAFAAEGCCLVLSARSAEPLAAAEEGAEVIVFLASPRAHWINGRHIAVDGLEQPHAPLDRRPF